MTRKKELHSAETREQFQRHYRKVELTPEQADIGLTSGCWLWNSTMDADGYGQFRWNGRLYRAHRFSYEYHNDTAPEAGNDIDHLCNHRNCVNPEHLDDVIHIENMRRQRNRDQAQGGGRPKTHILEARREVTVAEVALAWCLEHIRETKINCPSRYGVVEMKDAPWRAYSEFENKNLEPSAELTLLALYLYAISMGCPLYQTGKLLLDISETSIHRWKHNDEWRADFEKARNEGRMANAGNLEEVIMDTLQARLPHGDLKHSVRVLEILTRSKDAAKDRKVKAREGGSNRLDGPTFNFLFPAGTTTADVKQLTEQIINAEYIDVTPETSETPLPPPDEWDEDFEDA